MNKLLFTNQVALQSQIKRKPSFDKTSIESKIRQKININFGEGIA